MRHVIHMVVDWVYMIYIELMHSLLMHQKTALIRCIYSSTRMVSFTYSVTPLSLRYILYIILKCTNLIFLPSWISNDMPGIFCQQVFDWALPQTPTPQVPCSHCKGWINKRLIGKSWLSPVSFLLGEHCGGCFANTQ